MMTSALVLPDWLYKHHKKLMIDTVGVAILDGASRPSDHKQGVWALDEVDDLLGITGAAAAMAELRRRFALRVQQLLEHETRKALGLRASASSGVPVKSQPETTAPCRINLNAIFDDEESGQPDWAMFSDEDGLEEEIVEDEDEPMLVHPVRLKIGFARSLRLN